jgi:hypothetical protein
MNEFVGTSPWVAITKDVARKRRGPVVAAISYVGVRASEVLPLREGDFLICDASERAIKQGVTSAKALASYLRIGVKVFSHEGLHSKVVATESFAWVGSANASRNSRDNLTEASARIEGPACREAFHWALSLAVEDAELTAQDVRALAKLPVAWEARGGEPGRQKLSVAVPRNLRRLVVLELPLDASASEEMEAEKRKSSVKKSLSSQVSRLNYFFWMGNPRAEEGDFVIPVVKNRVSGLWLIVKISKLSGYRIYWYQPVKTPLRLSISQLRTDVEGLESGFDITVIDDKKIISKIVKRFGV